MMQMANNSDEVMKRFSVRLPRWHYKRLIWWARGKGQSISGMAERIIAARIEANEEQIERMIQDEADELGQPVDEVKKRWLEDAKYNPSIFVDEKIKEEDEGDD